MSKLGKELISTLKEAKKTGLVTLAISPDVASIRKRLHLSQHAFSVIYHINPETLKKWEQKKRKPDSVSRAYLKCIQEAPEIIKQLVNA